MTREQLIEALSPYGPVIDARIVVSTRTGRPTKRFAFCDLSTPESAEAAISALNGSRDLGDPVLYVTHSTDDSHNYNYNQGGDGRGGAYGNKINYGSYYNSMHNNRYSPSQYLYSSYTAASSQPHALPPYDYNNNNGSNNNNVSSGVLQQQQRQQQHRSMQPTAPPFQPTRALCSTATASTATAQTKPYENEDKKEKREEENTQKTRSGGEEEEQQQQFYYSGPHPPPHLPIAVPPLRSTAMTRNHRLPASTPPTPTTTAATTPTAGAGTDTPLPPSSAAAAAAAAAAAMTTMATTMEGSQIQQQQQQQMPPSWYWYHPAMPYSHLQQPHTVTPMPLGPTSSSPSTSPPAQTPRDTTQTVLLPTPEAAASAMNSTYYYYPYPSSMAPYYPSQPPYYSPAPAHSHVHGPPPPVLPYAALQPTMPQPMQQQQQHTEEEQEQEQEQEYNVQQTEMGGEVVVEEKEKENGGEEGEHRRPSSHQHQQPQQQLQNVITTLYVRGLPLEMEEIGLAQRYTPFGTVIATKILRNIEDGGSRGAGFVEFATRGEAQSALVQTDGSVDAEGRFVRVVFARRQLRSSKESTSTTWINPPPLSLPSTTTTTTTSPSTPIVNGGVGAWVGGVLSQPGYPYAMMYPPHPIRRVGDPVVVWSTLNSSGASVDGVGSGLAQPYANYATVLQQPYSPRFLTAVAAGHSSSPPSAPARDATSPRSMLTQRMRTGSGTVPEKVATAREPNGSAAEAAGDTLRRGSSDLLNATPTAAATPLPPKSEARKDSSSLPPHMSRRPSQKEKMQALTDTNINSTLTTAKAVIVTARRRHTRQSSMEVMATPPQSTPETAANTGATTPSTSTSTVSSSGDRPQQPSALLHEVAGATSRLTVSTALIL